MADTKITVLGFTGSGKTCYLAGMYNVMSLGMEGFTLYATDPARDLYLGDMWSKMYNEELGLDRFPPPSDQLNFYEFSLMYAYKEILRFDWLDYPGVILRAVGTEEFNKLRQELKASACLCMVVDGEIFAKEGYGEDYKKIVKKELEKKQIKASVSQLNAIAVENGYMPPIAIVITKSDLIPNFDKKAGVIKECIMDCFNALFKINEDDTIDRRVCIIAVSLGNHISENGFRGELEPQDIEQPIVFAVLSTLTEYLKMAKELTNNYNSKLPSLQGGIFKNWVNKGQIEKVREEINKVEAVKSKISKDMANLLDRFDNDKTMFDNGKEVNIHSYFNGMFS